MLEESKIQKTNKKKKKEEIIQKFAAFLSCRLYCNVHHHVSSILRRAGVQSSNADSLRLIQIEAAIKIE